MEEAIETEEEDHHLTATEEIPDRDLDQTADQIEMDSMIEIVTREKDKAQAMKREVIVKKVKQVKAVEDHDKNNYFCKYLYYY